MKAVCAIVFCTAVFLYTCFAQADMLAYRWQQFFGHAATWPPVVVSLLVTVLAALFAYIIYKVWFRRKTWTLRTCWAFLLAVCVVLIIAETLMDTSDVVHYRLRMERLLADGHTQKALQVGKRSRHTDKTLTMLRAYALAIEHQLGDRLFHYPMPRGGSSVLRPDTASTLFFLPANQIRQVADEKSAVDYHLCGLLLEKQLDAFAALVTKYYDAASPNMPRHYKEALTLYTHKRSNRVVTYRDAVLDADYEDFLKLVNNRTLSQSDARDIYGNTYWYYYVYK